jgi:hypothetical protein
MFLVVKCIQNLILGKTSIVLAKQGIFVKINYLRTYFNSKARRKRAQCNFYQADLKVKCNTRPQVRFADAPHIPSRSYQ